MLPQQRPVIAVLDEDAAMIGRAISGVQILGAPHELDAIISEFAVHGVEIDRIVIAGERDFLSPAVLRRSSGSAENAKSSYVPAPRMMGQRN